MTIGSNLNDFFSLLNAKATNCKRCHYYDSCIRKLVFRSNLQYNESGLYHIHVLFVIDSFTKEDQEQLKPLAGRYGDVFDAALINADPLSQMRWMLTPVVMCKPTSLANSSIPTPDSLAIKECSFHVKELVENLKPNAVIYIGKSAKICYQHIGVGEVWDTSLKSILMDGGFTSPSFHELVKKLEKLREKIIGKEESTKEGNGKKAKDKNTRKRK